MIITATTTQKFKVSDQWMKACGLEVFDSTFEVELIEDYGPVTFVTLRSDIVGHGGKWVVDTRRGSFI